MSRRLLFMMVLAVSVIGLAGVALADNSPPSGERINGGNGPSGGTVIEPVWDVMTGAIRYVSTPRGVPDPVNTNPRATAPFYLPVYPAGSLPADTTLNCQDVPAENCPDHGPAVAGLAHALEPGVYGAPGDSNEVIGHDHLMAGPGSHGDFNVAWVPTLVLFTPGATITRITNINELNAAISAGSVMTVRLDGTNGFPNLTFHCSVVSAAVYAHSAPFTP